MNGEVVQFISSCCLLINGVKIKRLKLWDAFKEWSENEERIGRNKFYRILNQFYKMENGCFLDLFLKDEDNWSDYERTIDKIYLISDGDYVKIGFSKDPDKRLNQLQIGSPRKLKLLAAFPGGREVELKLHEIMERKRIRGEWFELNFEDIMKIFRRFKR